MPLFVPAAAVTALFALTGFLLWRYWQRQARIQDLYRRLVHIRAEVPQGSEADLARLLANLQTVENEALQLLVQGRVAADAGMVIFLLLAQTVRGEIEAGYQEYQTEE